MTLSEQLEQALPPGGEMRLGELLLTRDPSGLFEARHIEDAMATLPLLPLDTPAELRELAKYDAAGEYRPLRSAPGLKAGWVTNTDSPAGFLKRLDAIYPGVFATTVAYLNGRIDPVPLRRTLDRQTGMYRFAGTISDEQADQIVEELCSPGCLRTIVWPIDDARPARRVESSAGSLPMVCTEACTFAVNLARQLSKKKRES